MINRQENPFRRFLDQPKLIIYAGYCIATGLVGTFGLVVMVGWLTNHMALTQLHSSLPPTPFNVAFSFFCVSLALLYSLARVYRLSRIIAIFLLIFSALFFFLSLLHLDFATDFPIFKSTSPNVIPVKTFLAFCFLSLCIVIFTSETKKLGHLWLIGLLCSIIFTMSLSAIFGHLNRIDGDHILIKFNKIDLHIAFGLFVLSSVILYLTYLKFRSAYPNFCMRWLSLLAFISLLWSTISFYGALKNQDFFYKSAGLAHEALQMLKFVVHQSDVDKKSLKRMLERWNAIAIDDMRIDLWQKDSQMLVDDIKPLEGLAILKPDKTILADSSQKDFPIKGLIKESLALLNLDKESWYPVKNKDGRNILFVYFLLSFPKNEKGYFIAFYDLESMIKTYPKFILKSEVCVNIFYQNKSLYFADEKAIMNEKNNDLIFSEQKINDWTIHMWTLAQDPKSFIRFPDVFLTLGILMSILIGFLFHLYQKFKRQSFLLQRANAAKSLFLANVSHEIRTPLHAIIGTASLLEFTELNSRQEHLLHILKVSSNHLLDLINNLLDITKIESGSIALKYIATDIRELSLETISLFSEKAEEKGLNLRFDFHFPEEQKIMIPPREMKQIMTNLIGNAIKFTEVGIVTLEVNVIRNGSNTGRLNINVSDTGIGIPEEKNRHIFEKFSQVGKDEKIKHSGTGLGLFISKLLVNQMNGQIRFESIDGQGTTFFISIPITFAPPETQGLIKI